MASILDLMDKTATLQRPTNTSDSAGGSIATYNTILSGVRCSLWPQSSGLGLTFERPDIIGSHVVCTSIDCGAKENDRWVVNGLDYIVLGVEPFSNAFVTLEEAFVHNVQLRVV